MKRTSRHNRHAPSAGRQIFIPHPSWTQAAPTGPAGRPLAPDEFWARLGL